ncbi:MAG: hypothetical protein HY878_06590 [Deltaproteobacteria bacterium]|nr:hypothetical protein [Deltaproteobacteria bacterium]
MKGLHAFLFAISFLTILSFAALAANDRITREELKAKMDRGEGIIILDVRVSADYMESKVKIKGAVRIDPGAIERRYKELPMDREIVAYCT